MVASADTNTCSHVLPATGTARQIGAVAHPGAGSRVLVT
jgi:hypothetical protein